MSKGPGAPGPGRARALASDQDGTSIVNQSTSTLP